MAKINVYLTFGGNCREAMTFYQEVLGGELYFQTVGESPIAGHLPPEIQATILHSTLTKGDLVIMASDMVSEQGLTQGNSMSLCLLCDSETEIRRFYEQLSAGGRPTHPLENSFWGA